MNLTPRPRDLTALLKQRPDGYRDTGTGKIPKNRIPQCRIPEKTENRKDENRNPGRAG